MAGSSVAGPDRSKSDPGGQDRHRIVTAASGTLVAVVSDGAGSASHGGEGAAILCRYVEAAAQAFLARTNEAACGRAALIRACLAIRGGIQAARRQAEASAAGRDGALSDYHATLVGAIGTPGGGLFFHIGDGAALALGRDGADWLLSPPRNGEFADTTYFFTEPDWRSNLRFAYFDSRYDTIFLMTDGVTEVALTREDGVPRPFLPFFKPIGAFLAGKGRSEGETALSATLDSAAIRARSADDKTLIWARRMR